METNNERGELGLPLHRTRDDAAALDIIRTETVLSRLPVHNLAKRGNVNIQIIKTATDGRIELKWIVSYSDRYGQARQLAYKLDTIVINHHIDEQGRPIPKMICLGSLRDVADQLDLGGDTNKVRRALRQNASAFITAKFEYRGNDNSKKTLEADFTRYSVVFTGEQLPDGRRADAVYIILNEPYREVLNNAPVRPLDRAYMKELPPGAQRFYEIISYKIFSAIKNDYPHAKLPYSEYCTFSAQVRHYERQPVQDQMAKVIRPHKESGYITGVRYEPTIDAENKPDWILYLSPGPKAHAEFAVAHRRKPERVPAAREARGGDHQLDGLRVAPRDNHPRSERIAAQPTFDPHLIAEFTHRGITEEKAQHLLANLKPGQDVVAQLEHIERTIQELDNSPTPVRNPAGFYVRLIERNIAVPEGFETSAKRKAREEHEQKERKIRLAKEAEQQLYEDYEDYCDAEINRYIEANPAAFETLKDTKWKEGRERFTFMTESMAKIEARLEIRKLLPLLTFDEFLGRKRQGTDFSLKLVAGSASAEPRSVDPPRGADIRQPFDEEAQRAIEKEIRSAAGGAGQGAVEDGSATTEDAPTESVPTSEVNAEPRVVPPREPVQEAPPTPNSGPAILFVSEALREPGSSPPGPGVA